MNKWEERLESMSDYDRNYLITGIEDGWIVPSCDDLHIYYKLKGIDEHPVLTWFKRVKCTMTGGCKFKGGTTQVHLDENDNVTITETCYKCSKQYSFTVPYSAFGEYVDIRLKGKSNEISRC